jgi:hypothetical protein
MKILLTPEAGEGGNPIPPAQPPGTPTPPPAPPPAATVVQNATKSERELQLETDLESERKAKKDREFRVAELEDENHRLKSAPVAKTPAVPEDDGRWRPFKL